MRPYVNPFDVNNFTIQPEIWANPAAGVSHASVAPVNARAELSLLSFQLVTDANAANRFVEVQLHRVGAVYVLGHSFSTQVASITRSYVAFPGCGVPSVVGGDRFCFSLPTLPLFLEGDVIHVVIINIQAADQLSDIRLTWKVWPYEQ